MSTLNAHLRKELRERRTTILALFAVLPFIIGGIIWMVPSAMRVDGWFHSVLASLSVVAVLLAVAGDLLVAERRGAGIRFLERVPGGLGDAFRAKFILLVVLTLVTALYGATIAGLVTRGSILASTTGSSGMLFLGGACTLALWVFAASAWVPHAALATPIALIAAVTVVGPYTYLLRYDYEPPTWEMVSAFLLVVILPVASAYRAFVVGSRFGRPCLHAAKHGLGVVALGAFVTSAWAGVRLAERNTVDPSSEGFSLGYSYVTEDGKVAFAEAWQAWGAWGERSFLLRIDLESGVWCEIGRDDDCFVATLAREQDRVLGSRHIAIISSDETVRAAFSRSDGRELDVDRVRADLLAGMQDVWAFDGLAQEWSVFDEFRNRLFREDELDMEPYCTFFVTRGRWMIDGENGEWYLFDPETGAREVPDWPLFLVVREVLPDGRALMADCAGDNSSGVYIGDPADGTLVELKTMLGKNLDYEFWMPSLGTPAERLHLGTYEGTYELDPTTLNVRRLDDEDLDSGLWSRDGRSIVQTLDGTIVSLDAETGERTTLFPRGS